MKKKLPLLLFLLLFFYLCNPFSSGSLSEKKPLLLIANQCDDDVRGAFVSAIKKAKKSIVLRIYSLNDPQIVKALVESRKRHVDVKIHLDSYNQKELSDLKDVITLKTKKSGLMHQKILIVDEEKVWIGSANFTATSLRVHDNLVAAFYSKEMGRSLTEGHGGEFVIGGQRIEVYFLPKEQKEAFDRLLYFLNFAKEQLSIAMFTWTHPILTQCVIDAHKRGVSVDIVLDENSYLGVSKQAALALLQENIDLKVNQGSPLLHHKFAYIDKKFLLLGSTNWTKAAFSKNDECILIIHDLNKRQRKKLDSLWHALRSTSF